MSLAPMQFAVAAEYVASDDTFVPVRAAVGLPFGIELGGAYWYVDTPGGPRQSTILTGKWVLPEFVPGPRPRRGRPLQRVPRCRQLRQRRLRPLRGRHLRLSRWARGWPSSRRSAPRWLSRPNGGDEVDGIKFFGSLLLKASMFAVGGEYISTDEDYDGKNADGSYWVGGRFFLNPMITLQAGYLNNAN